MLAVLLFYYVHKYIILDEFFVETFATAYNSHSVYSITFRYSFLPLETIKAVHTRLGPITVDSTAFLQITSSIFSAATTL